jgi:hypothetical protein
MILNYKTTVVKYLGTGGTSSQLDEANKHLKTNKYYQVAGFIFPKNTQNISYVRLSKFPDLEFISSMFEEIEEKFFDIKELSKSIKFYSEKHNISFKDLLEEIKKYNNSPLQVLLDTGYQLIKWCGKTSSYHHKHNDTPNPKETPKALVKTWVLNAQWSDCPIEVQKEVSRIYGDSDNLYNNSYWKMTLHELICDFPIIAQYFIEQDLGIELGDTILINYWW